MFRIIGFIVVSLLASRIISKFILPAIFGIKKPNQYPQNPPQRPEGTVNIQKNAPTNGGFTDYEEVK